MVGACRVELRFDFSFAAFADLRGDVRINHHGFAQGDKFCPAGFIGGQNLVGGKQVAHADKRQFAVDAFVDKTAYGFGRYRAATDFFYQIPTGKRADIAAVFVPMRQSVRRFRSWLSRLRPALRGRSGSR